MHLGKSKLLGVLLSIGRVACLGHILVNNAVETRDAKEATVTLAVVNEVQEALEFRLTLISSAVVLLNEIVVPKVVNPIGHATRE